jgi:hypothetical protein
MPDEKSTIQQTSPEETAIAADLPAHENPIHETAIPAQAPDTLVAYDPLTEDAQEWEEPFEELPRRPRRRLLGAGGNPIVLALLGVLLIACGFIGGVLVEKGQSSSSSSAGAGTAGLASRFAALRGGASGAGSSTTGSSSGSSTGGAFGGSPGSGTSFTRPTAGTVAYLAGSTLYVTNSEGNTVKVTTSAGTSVTKTVKSTVKGVHPGETVTVTGATGAKGTVSAESISVGSSGGGLASLFGGAGASASKGSGSAGSSGPALFGNGG